MQVSCGRAPARSFRPNSEAWRKFKSRLREIAAYHPDPRPQNIRIGLTYDMGDDGSRFIRDVELAPIDFFDAPGRFRSTPMGEVPQWVEDLIADWGQFLDD